MWRTLVVCLLVVGAAAAALSDMPDDPDQNSTDFQIIIAPVRDTICPEGQVFARAKCRTRIK